MESIEVAPRHARTSPRRDAVRAGQGIWAHIGLLALISGLVPLSGSWTVQVLLVPLLLVVPGLILLRTLRVPGGAVASFPVYIPAASLVVLLGSGLTVDLIGSLVGVAAPLRPAPLLLGLDVAGLALLWVARRAPQNGAIPWSDLSRSARLAWPLILPLIAAAGALRLNSGHRNTVALITVVACLLLLFVTFLVAHRLSRTLLTVILYAVGLAIMWSFSLRGDLVYGWDIATEYYDLHQTMTAGIWHVTHVGDAYDAMLAVTILPTMLHFLSGVPALLIFKVVYPMIGVLFPVGVFGLAQRILSRRWAFVAAAFIVIQASFGQQLTALARQEIALVLFAALFMAMLDDKMPRLAQWTLTGLFGAAMVVSHYSTTYVAIFFIGAAAGLQWVVSWFRRIPHITGSVVVALGAVILGGIMWYGPMTQSAAGLVQLVHSLLSQGASTLPNRQGIELVSATWHGNLVGHGTAGAYEQYIYNFDSAHRHYIVPLPQASLPQYALHDRYIPPPAVTWPFYTTFSHYAKTAQQVVIWIGALGALLLVLGRKTSVVARSIGLIALPAVAFLVMMTVSKTLALAYNETRAVLQSSTVLGITFGWTMERISGRRGLQQATVLTVVGASFAGMFGYNSWLGAALFGGDVTSNLSNSGADVRAFVMTAPDIASARWLAGARKPRQLTYADRYAQLRLITAIGLGNGLLVDVTPLSLSEHAWVYASSSNVAYREANAFYNGHVISYTFPFGYLNRNYDLVYTNGISKVYHR